MPTTTPADIMNQRLVSSGGEAVDGKGRLYIVSTPIGNLKDISARAIEILRQVQLVASEDTRRTGLLLKQLGISVRQISCHEFNEARISAVIVGRLLGGQDVALVSSAGTPLISDPGFRLVRACIDAGIEVLPIPGPSALLAALVISGLPTDRFCFEGFLPRKEGKLKARLQELKEEKRTMVFYESPQRISKSLSAMLEIMGDRAAYVGRELTKKFESSYRGTLSSLISVLSSQPARGEFVIVVSGKKNG